jgi:hypothetical protein
MDDPTPDDFDYVLAPDTADARLFIELSSYLADLTEATVALDLVLDSTGENPDIDRVALQLVGYAVVAYCRTYFPSKVRKKVTEHIQIPDALLDIHEMIGAYRNTTIAHSQSQLSTTVPVLVIRANPPGVVDLIGASTIQPLPSEFAAKFRELVEAVDELVGDLIDEVRERILFSVRDVDVAELIANSPPREVTHASSSEFTPRSRRPSFPAAQTFYWSVAGDQ